MPCDSGGGWGVKSGRGNRKLPGTAIPEKTQARSKDQQKKLHEVANQERRCQGDSFRKQVNAGIHRSTHGWHRFERQHTPAGCVRLPPF